MNLLLWSLPFSLLDEQLYNINVCGTTIIMTFHLYQYIVQNNGFGDNLGGNDSKAHHILESL